MHLKNTQIIRPPPGVGPETVRPPSVTRVYMTTAFVSLGAFLFGYDQGVMGVIVADERWIALMEPSNSYRVGRERFLALAAIIFIIGAIIQAASYSIVQITIGRVVLGIGVGACAGGVPLYISEIAPAAIRGRIIAIEQMVLCFGELFAFWLNYGFNYLTIDSWWRIPLAIQIIPAAILAVGCWRWVPPSPRWLVAQERHECAREVLTRFHGSEAANLVIQEILDEVVFEKMITHAGWGDMFKIPVLMVTVLGMTIQFFQQITGTNSILYYTPSLFKGGGITNPHTSNLATGGVGIVLFVFAWIPILWFDRLGRKTWLQIGTVGMMCAMIGITVLQWHSEGHPGSSGNYAIIAFPYLFYIFFNISWGVASWTYASEIFPLSMRSTQAKGSALCTASLWTGCYIVAQASPPVGAAIRWKLYIIYACICAVAFVFVRYALVETRGRTLEEMARLFGIESKLAERSGVVVEKGEIMEPTMSEHEFTPS
ncbi:Quinate transporter [Hyphodiscus hymeniophilus]|uniref:Quinate transporter n=1 Tax=Hyphodiscus hymeniophilus TaxID=353542 RepID=A0A9P6VHM0_9HELO|nr:Quinate transporter [Hyphodiscus hymeniophilus]